MGRMFPLLPAHVPDDQAIVDFAKGIPAKPAENPPNPAIRAGFTFLGQFIDHDTTFDKSSLLVGSNDPDTLISESSAKFDLDSVYGDGPAGTPQFYDPSDPAKLRLVINQHGVLDVPRDSNGKAIIADPRNDQTVILIQLQIAFMRFHNAIVDLVRSQGVAEDLVFTTAQQMVRWHYQWVVVHEYLPITAGQRVVDQVLVLDESGVPTVLNQFFLPSLDSAFIPVEFSVAAFRFGHTQVRDRYRVNPIRNTVGLLGTFDNSLIGGRPVPADLVIEWGNFFPISGSSITPQTSMRIDGRISLPLGKLPVSAYPGIGNVKNLAERNMRRAKSFGLPSGQQVAALMGAQVFTNAELGVPDAGFQNEAPLWFYILKEGDLQQNGNRLGQVGARIVVEVLLGLMAADSTAYLVADALFQPVPPIAPSDGTFTTGDLLKFAGTAGP
ncbi:MAG: peroxidase family protein [Actinomycetota bacterium]